MGFKYEMNWYLVVKDKCSMTLDRINKIGHTSKDGNRQYPLHAPIPLILKQYGCIALIEITSVENAIESGCNKTDVIFRIIKYYDDIQDPISSHYYNMYLGMRNRNKTIGKFDFELLKSGTILKRKSWHGFWKWEKDTIMMYCKSGKALDIRKTSDVSYTLNNMFADDWEIAPQSLMANFKCRDEDGDK